MIAQAMVWMAATAALLGLAARALEEVLRSYGRPTRWVWVAALCASAALPLLAVATDGAFPGRVLRGAAPSVDLDFLFASAEVSVLEPSAVEVGGSGPVVERVAVIAWALASTLAFAVYALTWLRLARARRGWRADRIDDTPVLLSSRGGPAVLGVIRPAIVVPEWLRCEPATSQRLVLLHEREHVRARDHALLAVAPLFAVALPWNAALWWQLRRLRLAIEVDCDRRVLAHGVAPGAYGALLLDIARRGGPALVGAAALAEPRTFLERRILAMSSTIPRLRLARALALTAGAAVLALVACETAMPTNVTVPEPRTIEPEASVVVEQPLEILEKSAANGPIFLIDGDLVDERMADILAPEDIESIEIMKGAAAVSLYGPAGANGVVQIFTKQSARALKRREQVETRSVEEIRIRETPRIVKWTPLTGERYKVDVEETVRAKVERQKVIEARESAGVIKLRSRSPVRTISPEPVIMIDGVIVSDDDMNRLSPERIERIEVLKGAAAAAVGLTDGRGLIRIITRK